MRHPTGYSALQIALHWIVVVLVAVQFAFHERMSEAWRALGEGGTVAFDPMVALHVVTGLLVAALVVWRLVLRFGRGVPAPPRNEHPALRAAAIVTHWSFYGLLLLLPLSGAAAWFGGVGRAAEAHEIFKTVLLALVAVHVAAALFHQFVLRTDVLTRMRKTAG